jgi:hypothetical protein
MPPLTGHSPLLLVPIQRLQEYLPISGNPEFNRLARTLALGPSSSAIQQARVATVQALSGEHEARELLAVACFPVPSMVARKRKGSRLHPSSAQA